MILSSACRSFGVSFDVSAVNVVGAKRAIFRARSGSPACFCPTRVVEISVIAKTIEVVNFNEVIFLELTEDFAHLTRETRKRCGRQTVFVSKSLKQDQRRTMVHVPF